MSKEKDNIIPFPTKVKAPDTLTVSFGESDPVTYTISEEDLVNTVSITLSDYENFKSMAADWYDFGDSDISTGDVDTITLTMDNPIDTMAIDDDQFEFDFDFDDLIVANPDED